MNSPYFPALDDVTLPVHPSLPYDSAGEAYEAVYPLFAPRLSLPFQAEGRPNIDMHLYVFSTGATALVTKPAGGPVEVASILPAGENSRNAMRLAAETAIDRVGVQGYRLSSRPMPTLTPEEELGLWTQVAGPLGLDADTVAEFEEGYDELVLAQLGDVLLKRYSDDELQETLALACAFVAADEQGMLGDDFLSDDLQDSGPMDKVQLIAWAYLLIQAGRGTREGAVIALNELVALEEEEGWFGATEALFNRIGTEPMMALQDALNDELAVIGDGPAWGPCPVRFKLSSAVAQNLAPAAADLYAWLQSEDGFTSWLRPDFTLLGDYRDAL